MVLFEKEINIKDYSCSPNPRCFHKCKNMVNLYVQACPECNACCDFCNTDFSYKQFDYGKLKETVAGLEEEGVLGRISVTGGEPLLHPERTAKILEIAHGHHPGLNTNGFSTDRLKEVYNMAERIYVSRHYYNNETNSCIMGLRLPPIEELSEMDKNNKITMHCVLQKGFIDSSKEMETYMDILGETSIRKVKFISLYGLTEAAKRKMVDISPMMERFMKCINSGLLYDKHYCCCLDFVYITKAGKVVNGLLRHNKTNHFDCCRQFVYDGSHLFDGFEKKNIIL